MQYSKTTLLGTSPAAKFFTSCSLATAQFVQYANGLSTSSLYALTAHGGVVEIVIYELGWLNERNQIETH